MRIRTAKAVEYFFSSSSLAYIYFEAIANSIDANASEIKIHISIKEFLKHESLEISIVDNGDGFNEKNFKKFCHVLEVDDKHHKGIGRLVFLNYFEKVNIDSYYNGKYRHFVFDEAFEDEYDLQNVSDKKKETTLNFKGYKKGSIKSYDYLVPEKIKKEIIKHFFPKFYSFKLNKCPLEISISLSTEHENNEQGFVNKNIVFSVDELPELKERELSDPTALFGKFTLRYSIKHSYTEQSIISAICADERTINYDVLSSKELPPHYEMIFILYSDYFNGKTDNAREKIEVDDYTLKLVRKMFIKLISQVIREEIPEVVNKNEETRKKVQSDYPHLQGFFDDESIGLVDKNNLINEAQQKYFYEQKELLEAAELTDAQYSKSLDFSSRVLTEYVLYREKIIKKLRAMNTNNQEAEIHNLIVPKNKRYVKDGGLEDYFSNNAWVLDDKYMSYSKVLSNKDLETIYSELEVNGSHKYSEKDKGIPDVTIIFSGDPNSDPYVDVVIIEFKKLELGLARKEEVISQLRQRARRLLKVYPNRIQRIWFYGIVDFDKEFISTLIEDGFIELFSTGEVYYKAQKVFPDPDNSEDSKIADIYILSYKTMLDDAESRNSTFLDILKKSIKAKIKNEN
jgi:hypothetical protein